MSKFFKLDVNYGHLGLKPDKGYFSGATIRNDEFIGRISTGTLLIKPSIHYFSGNGVTFTDGTTLEDLDAVICCTGYKTHLKFLDESVFTIKNNELHCYKFVFPIHHSRHTLAFIGFIHTTGATIPAAELQCRWATRVFKGLATLPPNDVMKDDVTKMYNQLKNQFGEKLERYSLYVS